MSTFKDDGFDAPAFPSDSQVWGAPPLTATIPTGPPITKVAKFLAMTDKLEEARRFYSGVLGYDGVFRNQRAIPARAELSVFKVADEQYIEVAPALQNPANDKLIQIGFATAEARKLRDYLALPATTPLGVNT